MFERLPFADDRDFADAQRGFIASIPGGVIKGPDGAVVWSQKDYAFLETADPDVINPSLLRVARLNTIHGLFEIVPGMYQIRGLDGSNMTLIEGETGVIVVDTLMSVETASAALDLYFQHRPRRPVSAVLLTHTHADHWGGIAGVVNEADVLSGKMPVIAPEGFLHHVVTESILAGNAMARRTSYQFGPLLPKSKFGQVDIGLGKAIPRGRQSLIAPNEHVCRSGETRTIDGVEFVFMMAPDSEAPAEFYFYCPQFKVLNMAELTTRTFHNLLPFRGAEVRDSLAWSKYINEALVRFGDRTDILIAQHQWPAFGREAVQDYLASQRDLYRFVHDQSVRLLNQGYTAPEIAEHISLPDSLAGKWHCREYYGTLKHNSRAVYQKYLGWYDANPANLDPLTPVEGAKKYIEYMGGADAVLARARSDFANGEYRFVAEVANKLVFADPQNLQARELAADAYEQLGYLSESAMWRNAYLTAALELRKGQSQGQGRKWSLNPATINAVETAMLFDVLAVQLNAGRAGGKRIVLNWTITEPHQSYALVLENCALSHMPGWTAPDADATLSMSRQTMNELVMKRLTAADAVRSGAISVEGDAGKLEELFALFETFDPYFDIVEPGKRAP
ncbi:MAG: MBL fold metallo-hydrolase [Hyphomicrobiales bacterium]|nr:MBL fold metallo-hydrolase [Hyphomicrobiales bacterium]